MKNITFTILNNNNQLITLNCTLKENDNRIYRCGVPVFCNCQGNDNPTPYLFLNNEVYCPSCGKKSLTVTLEKDNADLKLLYIGLDNNTLQRLYRLSDTLHYNQWLKVADYFAKLKTYDVDLGYDIDYVGWVTMNPLVVEEILGIPDDLSVSNRDVENELNESLNKIETNEPSISESEIFDIVDKLHEVFSVVETPYGEFDLFNNNSDVSDGVIVENPLFPPNKVGVGELWCVRSRDMEIWYVRYNFRPGDDLRFNNVLLDGELKAIGKVIGYDENVVELLERLDLKKE